MRRGTHRADRSIPGAIAGSQTGDLCISVAKINEDTSFSAFSLGDDEQSQVY